MRNTGLEEIQAGIKIARRNINNLGYANDTTLLAESEQELKSLLMKMKEESEKVALKLNIQKTKIMASGPITSWEIDEETVETVSDFIFLGSKITADGDCSHEIKRHLLLGRKAMTNLDSILKSRDITDKGPSGQSYGFSSSYAWMYGCGSSSSLSAIRVVSSAYLRLLIFLPAILIPACASSSPVFLTMYTAYKLNKQGDNIQS